MSEIMTSIVENLLISGLSAIVVIEYLRTFFEKKNVKAFVYWLWGIYYIWQTLVTDVLNDSPAWSRMVLSILFIIIPIFFFHGDMGGKIVFLILYVTIGMLVEAVTGCIFLLLRIPIESHMFIGSIVSKGMLLLIVKCLQLFFLNRAVRELSWKTDLILMLLPVGSMILSYHIFMTDYQLVSSGITQGSVICILIILAINIIVFNFYIRLSENMEFKHKASIYEKEIDLLDNHVREKERTMQELRRWRHDWKYQMTGLLQLLKDRNYKQLEESIVELVDLKTLGGLNIADSDHSIIDALINYKYETAKKHNIEFKVRLDIPSQLPFASGDLCVILGNILDNALEANLRGNVEQPYIDLKMRYEANTLVIVIENSFDGNIIQSKIGEYITRKVDKENHGMGITSIKNILNKYHGYYDVIIDNNIYCLNILLHDNE